LKYWYGPRARRGRAALIWSFPIRRDAGKWGVVQNVLINDFSRSKIDASVAELKEEKSLVGEQRPRHIAGLTAYTLLIEAVGITEITIVTGTPEVNKVPSRRRIELTLFRMIAHPEHQSPVQATSTKLNLYDLLQNSSILFDCRSGGRFLHSGARASEPNLGLWRR
jgi:hypothetical protein